jgi:hypothetical protein
MQFGAPSTASARFDEVMVWRRDDALRSSSRRNRTALGPRQFRTQSSERWRSRQARQNIQPQAAAMPIQPIPFTAAAI